MFQPEHIVREGLVVKLTYPWLIEASELDLAPGEWPPILGLLKPDGEVMLFYRAWATRSAGEIVSFLYVCNDLKLVVVND